jgi:hypothetical protein
VQFEVSVLLECGAASLGDWRRTFRDGVVVSSRGGTFKPLKTRSPRCLETSLNDVAQHPRIETPYAKVVPENI